MSKIEPDEILRRAEELGRVQPGPESTARVVQRVRQALEADQRVNRSRRMRNKIMKIAIPSGIAAAVLLAVGLWLTVQTSQPVSAAEQLKEVVKVNTAYKGWIHVILETVNSPKSAPSSAKIPRSGVTHINTADNTIIQVVDFVGGERAVMYASVSRREIIYYSSRTNEIKISAMDSYSSQQINKGLLDQTTAKGILDLISEGEREKFNVKKSKDGRYERFDVIPLGEAGFKSAVLLVDPESKLVHKFTVAGGMNRDDLDIILKYTYGKPVIKDIYSLGVPRDAKVVDNRPTKQVKSVLDRLAKRIEKGFGDHVAVMTISRVLPGGELDTDRGTLRIFAKNGTKWISYQYRVGKSTGAKGSTRVFSPPVLPKGWPRPDVKEVLKQTRDAPAIQYFIMDGRKIWAGIYHSKSKSYESLQGMGRLAKFPGIWKAEQTVAGQIWPSTRAPAQRWYGPGIKTKLLSDKKRPKHIGLHKKTFSQMGQGAQGAKQRQETILWLDTARDDLPVEKTWRVYGGEGKTVQSETRTQYLDYAKLPDGQWYPTRWRETRSQAPGNKKGGKPRISVQEYNLQIIPGMKLDKEWFTNPAERLKTRKAR